MLRAGADNFISRIYCSRLTNPLFTDSTRKLRAHGSAMRHFGSVHSQQTPFGVVKRVVVDHASIMVCFMPTLSRTDWLTVLY